ncbi:hypothetical protein C8R44DRAFT_771524 [Mycena epipterygia]|nr:hypothetical protein C8R44DRAFT_771524 [Mycena epipterygia]
MGTDHRRTKTKRDDTEDEHNPHDEPLWNPSILALALARIKALEDEIERLKRQPREVKSTGKSTPTRARGAKTWGADPSSQGTPSRNQRDRKKIGSGTQIEMPSNKNDPHTDPWSLMRTRSTLHSYRGSPAANKILTRHARNAGNESPIAKTAERNSNKVSLDRPPRKLDDTGTIYIDQEYMKNIGEPSDSEDELSLCHVAPADPIVTSPYYNGSSPHYGSVPDGGETKHLREMTLAPRDDSDEDSDDPIQFITPRKRVSNVAQEEASMLSEMAGRTIEIESEIDSEMEGWSHCSFLKAAGTNRMA